MKHSMIVKKQFRPGGSGSPQTIVGDEIEATDQQKRLWKALGWADDAPEKPPEKKPFFGLSSRPQYETKVVAPEPVAEPAPRVPMKRTYLRRDLTAEPNKTED